VAQVHPGARLAHSTLDEKWGSRPLWEFMGEPDPINGGYGRYRRLTSRIRPDPGSGLPTTQDRLVTRLRFLNYSASVLNPGMIPRGATL